MSENISNYRFICLHAAANGYRDIKMFPSSIPTDHSSGGGRGVSLYCYANSDYYSLVNVRITNKTAVLTSTSQKNWIATVEIYGVK